MPNENTDPIPVDILVPLVRKILGRGCRVLRMDAQKKLFP